jgi:hypothetical protein
MVKVLWHLKTMALKHYLEKKNIFYIEQFVKCCPRLCSMIHAQTSYTSLLDVYGYLNHLHPNIFCPIQPKGFIYIIIFSHFLNISCNAKPLTYIVHHLVKFVDAYG